MQQAGPSLKSCPSKQRGSLQDWIALFEHAGDALDTDNESVDPSFDLDDSHHVGHNHMAEYFCEEWISSLTGKIEC